MSDVGTEKVDVLLLFLELLDDFVEVFLLGHIASVKP